MGKEFSFQWHITDFCNLRCKHCYQDIFDRSRELTYDRLIHIIQDISGFLKEQGFERLSINITGGEPLIYPYINPILKALDEIDIIDEINIITNGIIMPDIVLKGRYERLKYLKVSLEGAREETNDLIRGRGIFKRVIGNLKNTNYNFLLMFTLAKYNYRELDDMYRLSQNLGAKGFILERFIPLGEGSKIKDMVLNSKDWYQVVDRVATWADLTVEDLLPYKAFYIDFEENRILGALCNLGESCAVMPNGDVYPCRRFPLVLGNLSQESFSKIYPKILDFRANFTKGKLKGKCFLCAMEDCIGCRALSFSLFSDSFAEDYQCWL
ncbi:radical SAM protein [Dictyoglomus turgidum]|uniref:radical SAM protein n=1 Tax=Dictyoglomus turgidum TaxID=513050 RepID=UPI000CCDC654|nr:radical SAM protein [Dictyoglomus turgidum]PNV78865.1 MAG: radical SAM/SPASM domain-containing protein [Dictyoglomus turgidum]